MHGCLDGVLPATDACLGLHATGTGDSAGPRGGLGLPGGASGLGPSLGRGANSRRTFLVGARTSTGQEPQPLPPPGAELSFPSTWVISMHDQSLPSGCPLCAWNKPAFFPGGWCSSLCPGASQWLQGPIASLGTLKEKKKFLQKDEALAPQCLGSMARAGFFFLPRLKSVEQQVTAVSGPSGQDLLSLPAPVCSWGCQACY